MYPCSPITAITFTGITLLTRIKFRAAIFSTFWKIKLVVMHSKISIYVISRCSAIKLPASHSMVHGPFATWVTSLKGKIPPLSTFPRVSRENQMRKRWKYLGKWKLSKQKFLTVSPKIQSIWRKNCKNNTPELPHWVRATKLDSGVSKGWT